MSSRTLGRLVPCLAVLAGTSAAAVAATGAGRTDELRGAPYYRSYAKSLPAAADVVALPVRVDPSSADGAAEGHGRLQALRLLADELNRHLSTLNWVRPVEAVLPEAGAPSVYVGSADGEDAPPAAMDMAEPGERAPMVIHVQYPSNPWRTALGGLLAERSARGAVLVTLGFSEFSKSYRSTFSKRVVLGTGYETDIRFLSAELEPVHVLCVSGALIDENGKVVRAGAEGILSEDSPFWAQSIGARKELDTDSVLRLLEQERRDDLAGRPLKWQVALENLVAQLIGEQSHIIQ